MASWITGGVVNYASHTNHLISFPVFSTATQLPTSCRLRLLMRNSTGNAETSATESVSPAEVPKGPPSLISAANVEKALRGIEVPTAITGEDHYGRLGIERGCSSDEVRAAYENKVLEVMNEAAAAELGDQEQLLIVKQLDLLKESYGILCTDEERRLYDWSLGRNDSPERYMWPFEVDKTPLVSTENPPPQQPEDVRPTRLLGYFISTWFFLSIILLILFNNS